MNTLGGKIQNKLFELNITQSELATELGVTKAAVSAWCKDIRKPSQYKLKKLCLLLDLKLEDFFEYL